MYFDPESLGVVPVATLSRTSEPYTFSYADVWYRPSDGWFYAASDSGCSCPSPYEWLTDVSHFEGPFTRAAVMAWMRNQYSEDPADRIDAVERIRRYDKPTTA